MEQLEKQYQELLDSQVFQPEELDYSLLDKHITLLSQLSQVANTGITVFDMYQKKHVYTSFNFSEIFGYDLKRIENENTAYFNARIHPEDLARLTHNGITALRYFLEDKRDVRHTKMINEYRILDLKGEYIRVIEQYQVLEFDPSGNVWLSLSMLDISPDTNTRQSVQSKLLNCKTGQTYTLPEFSEYKTTNTPHRLSPQEKKILKLVRDGLLSKEISDRLAISVHTVNTHRQRILEKLNVDNSIEAIRYASHLGWLD